MRRRRGSRRWFALALALIMAMVGFLQQEASAAQVEIIEPNGGDPVGSKADVVAKIPSGCRHPRALVGPLANMTYFVQPKGLLRGDLFDAEVNVGTETEGCGRRFMVVVVCDGVGQLEQGEKILDLSPFDLRSEQILVRRECPSAKGNCVCDCGPSSQSERRVSPHSAKSEERSAPIGATGSSRSPTRSSASEAPDGGAPHERWLIRGRSLEKGLDMGVDSGQRRSNWLSPSGMAFRASYPSNQGWGVLFLTVGRPQPPGRRATQDFSEYSRLLIEMRGESGGERVEVGIKDGAQPDNGSETKIATELHTSWMPYTFELSRFKGARLKSLYIPFEIVFSGNDPVTIYFRNVKYMAR